MDFLKVLIADDEENIRNGLKCIIDWEKLGCKISGEVSNGKEAVNQIIDLQPDLIILDIKMPGLTGLEVIKQIKPYYEKNNLFFPSIIILSGYSDFTYAQTAVNSGAKAYLLKPVDEDELERNVKVLASEIREKKNFIESKSNILKLEIKDVLVKLIKNGQIISSENADQFEFLKNARDSNFQAIIISLDKLNRNSDSSKIEIEKSLENYFSFFKYEILDLGNTLCVIIKTSNEVAVKNCVERAGKLFKERTVITLGQNLSGIEGLLLSYNQAKELTDYLFFISDKPFIASDVDFSEFVPYTKENLDTLINQLIFCIEVYDKNKLDNLEKEANGYFYNLTKKESDVKKDMIYCLVELRNRLSAKYPERDIFDGDTFDVVSEILKQPTYEASFIYFKNILNNFIENFNFNTADSVIVKVISYVKSNYSADLKLETLGEMFNCNSAYLGKKFKKYTGVQFNSYLDNIRIEVAKEKLLNSDYKIYQISKMVGFTNTDYFFMKFKKYTGLTPKEFKKLEDEKRGISDDENESEL